MGFLETGLPAAEDEEVDGAACPEEEEDDDDGDGDVEFDDEAEGGMGGWFPAFDAYPCRSI